LRKRFGWGAFRTTSRSMRSAVLPGQPDQPTPVVPGDRSRVGAHGHAEVGHLWASTKVRSRKPEAACRRCCSRADGARPPGSRRRGALGSVPPGIPRLREAVHQHHQRARARFDAVQAQPTDIYRFVGHITRASHPGDPHFCRMHRYDREQPSTAPVRTSSLIADHFYQEISTSSCSN
jgi:hypothetical protein